MKVNVWVAVDADISARLRQSLEDPDANAGNIPAGKLRGFLTSKAVADSYDALFRRDADGRELWDLVFDVGNRNPSAIRALVNQFFTGWQQSTEIMGAWDIDTGLPVGRVANYVYQDVDQVTIDPDWDGEVPIIDDPSGARDPDIDRPQQIKDPNFVPPTVTTPVPTAVENVTGTEEFPTPAYITDFMPKPGAAPAVLQQVVVRGGQKERRFVS